LCHSWLKQHGWGGAGLDKTRLRRGLEASSKLAPGDYTTAATATAAANAAATAAAAAAAADAADAAVY
jgi:hypothetical protein